MDWSGLRRQICEARRFSEGPEGLRLLSDVIMPSGGLIWVTIQPRGAGFAAHDGGASFDELARHGAEIKDMRGVRKMLAQTNFRMDDDGFIWCDDLMSENVASCPAFVADASFRAAEYMLAHASVQAGPRLDSRVKDALRLRYPEGRPDYTIQGLNRQHTFDFGVSVDNELIVVQSVTPDPVSISASIVKGLDVSKVSNARIRSVLIYDPEDDWGSDKLNMLQLGGAQAFDVNRLSQLREPLTIQ